MKHCTKCFELKSLDEYYFCNPAKTRLASWCKKCSKTYSADRHRKDPKRYAQQKEWVKNNPKSIKNSQLKYSYGITLDIYEQMLVDQKGLCLICFKPETRKFKSKNKVSELVVDHCHKTGKVRGLLCSSCNTAIGHLRENPETIKNILTYLG